MDLWTNKKRDVNVSRLRAAMRAAYADLRSYRQDSWNAINLLKGNRYYESPTSKQYMNLLELGVTTFTSLLAANEPQILITSPSSDLERTALMEMLSVNHAIKEVQFAQTNKTLLACSLMSCAIATVGSRPKGDNPIRGWEYDSGVGFIDPILVQDWVCDTLPDCYERTAFAGHKYRVNLEEAMEMRDWDKQAREKLEASHPGEHQPNDGERQLNEMSRATPPDEEFEDQVWVQNVWLRRDNMIVTMPVDESKPPLWIREWEGPEKGPYHLFGYTKIPGNVMPMPPAAMWIDMHEIANEVYRKLVIGAKQYKTNPVVAAEDKKLAELALKAKHQEVLTAQNARDIGRIQQGGIDSALLAFTVQLRDLFSYMAGNLDALGGLGAQAETLGQEEIIKGSASQRVQHMQAQYQSFIKAIMQDFHWHIRQNHTGPRNLAYRLPDEERDLKLVYRPDERSGDWEEYNLNIVPYSMVDLTPAARSRILRTFWHEDILPVLPIIMQQGGNPDVQYYLETQARLLRIPELSRFVVYQEPSPMQQQGPVGGVPQSPTSKRVYERRNIPGATEGGKRDVMQRLLLGSGVQGSEMNSVFQPTG